MNQVQRTARSNRRAAWILGGLAIGMFGFGFALVPLYNLLCSATGIQAVSVRTRADGAVTRREAQAAARELVVKFDVVVHPELPWDFHAEVPRIKVKAGESYLVNFVAENRSSSRITGQAIPNVVPWQATPYFNKVECFCFNRQTLEGGEAADMPLRFIVSPDLPEGINSLTLSYSFMRLDVGDAVDLASSEPYLQQPAALISE